MAADLSATLVADIHPGVISSNPEHLTNVNGTLFFGTDDVNNPTGLWKSDGTAVGTVLLKNGRVEQLKNVDGTLYFSSAGGAVGWELWKSNGTVDGTVLLKAVAANGLTPAHGKAYFSGNDGKTGAELWVSDGTPAGTKLVKDIYSGTTKTDVIDENGRSHRVQSPNSAQPLWLIDLNGMVFFSADDGIHGRELWKSNGTAKGTMMVKDISPGSSNPKHLTVVNGAIYFAAAGGLWRSDGTATGTLLVKNINADNLTNVNGILYFTENGGSGLWKTDGTVAGTVLVNAGTFSNLTDVNSMLLLAGYHSTTGWELWQSDGTAAGTVMIKDVHAGSSGSSPANLTNVNGLLYFAADDGVNGRELWQSDGTTAGTVLVRDIYVGAESSNPGDLITLNNKLYFAATDPEHGRELWDPPAVEPTSGTDYLLVTDWSEDRVLRYDASNGAFVNTFVAKHSGGLNDPIGVLFGPHDHDLYVSSGQLSGNGQLRGVPRYDGTTGAFLDVSTESGRLTSPRGIIFGPEGDLYVADATFRPDGAVVGRVVRFNGATGAFVADFVPAASGGLGRPGGLLFGPNGKNDGTLDLYVASSGNDRILRFDGSSGAFLGEFVSDVGGWLDHPTSISFGPDGNLYVANWAAGDGNLAVLRFQGPSGKKPGAPLPSAGNSGADFVAAGRGGLLAPVGVVFGPDGNGDGHLDLYVTNSEYHGGNALAKNNTGTVKRYDGVTGGYIDTFINVGSGGLREPFSLTFAHTDPVTLAYTGGALVAAAVPPEPVNETLHPDQVQPMLNEAIFRWKQTDAAVASLTSNSVRVADLPGTQLGQVVGNTIWIDRNASGAGWFVDPTPRDDREFTLPGNQGEQNYIDLLTIVMQELGHLLGHDPDEEGVMAETLAAGRASHGAGPK